MQTAQIGGCRINLRFVSRIALRSVVRIKGRIASALRNCSVRSTLNCEVELAFRGSDHLACGRLKLGIVTAQRHSRAGS